MRHLTAQLARHHAWFASFKGYVNGCAFASKDMWEQIVLAMNIMNIPLLPLAPISQNGQLYRVEATETLTPTSPTQFPVRFPYELFCLFFKRSSWVACLAVAYEKRSSISITDYLSLLLVSLPPLNNDVECPSRPAFEAKVSSILCALFANNFYKQRIVFLTICHNLCTLYLLPAKFFVWTRIPCQSQSCHFSAK